MSIKTIIIKNVDTVDHTYAGQLVEDADQYTIQSEAERVKFAANELLNQHIWSSPPLAVISDGINDFSSVEGDSYLKLINEIKIQEETIKTEGDLIRIVGKKFVIPATIGWHVFDFSFPYPISIYDAFFADSAEKADDICHLEIAPETILGVLGAPTTVNDVEFTVNQTVIDNMKRGRIVTLDDGTNKEMLGECIAIDTVNSKITVQTGCGFVYPAGTTYVKMTTRMVDCWYFEGQAFPVELGQGFIGGSYFAANTIFRVNYYNSVTTTKQFKFVMEIKY